MIGFLRETNVIFSAALWNNYLNLEDLLFKCSVFGYISMVFPDIYNHFLVGFSYYYFMRFFPTILALHWSLSDYKKSTQVCMTLFSILANLNKAVVTMLFARPSISDSSS